MRSKMTGLSWRGDDFAFILRCILRVELFTQLERIENRLSDKVIAMGRGVREPASFLEHATMFLCNLGNFCVSSKEVVVGLGRR